MNENIAKALVKAQRNAKTPEGRMHEASMIRQVFLMNPPIPQRYYAPAIDRLLSRVMYGASDCWYWVGSTDALGYGRLPIDGENKAHRVSYKAFKGNIPAGMKVMHTCDTRCCVNPEHLILGTQADNVADMMAKGRLVPPKKMFGEANPMARATREIVLDIRESVKNGATQKEMALKHGLSKMAVNRIVRNQSWK